MYAVFHGHNGNVCIDKVTLIRSVKLLLKPRKLGSKNTSKKRVQPTAKILETATYVSYRNPMIKCEILGQYILDERNIWYNCEARS